MILAVMNATVTFITARIVASLDFIYAVQYMIYFIIISSKMHSVCNFFFHHHRTMMVAWSILNDNDLRHENHEHSSILRFWRNHQ